MDDRYVTERQADRPVIGDRNQASNKLSDDTDELDPLALNQVQLLLAEKRTSLAVLRTGLAVLVLPMSVMSLLVATSKYYDVFDVLHIFIPLGLLNVVLIFFGFYLIVRAIISMRHYDRLIKELKVKHSFIGKFIS